MFKVRYVEFYMPNGDTSVVDATVDAQSYRTTSSVITFFRKTGPVFSIRTSNLISIEKV